MTSTFVTSRVSDEERCRVESLLPEQTRGEATDFIRFIEEYYRFLNTTGLPSREVAEITSDRDVDVASAKYLDAIGREIAAAVPNGAMVDRVNLYKRVVRYYSTRGTEDSIVVFFRIFFNELVEIWYPKVDILRPSDGKWDESTGLYISRDGFLSDEKVLQDGDFYQEFSYLIRSPLPLEDWSRQFSRLVHPAGLKFFAEIALFLVSRRTWRSWLSGYEPGQHSPLVQPGWIDNSERALLFVLTASTAPSPDHIRLVLAVISSTMSSGTWYMERLHSSYDWLKVFDSTPVGDYADVVPLAADGSLRPYSRTGFSWNNISCLITLK